MATMADLDWLADKQLAPLIDRLLVAVLKEKNGVPIDNMLDELRKMGTWPQPNDKHVSVADVHCVDVHADGNTTQADFKVERQSGTPFPSPLQGRSYPLSQEIAGVVYNSFAPGGKAAKPLVMEASGPKRELHFDPEQTTIGVVSCGGLCPGLNDVIRAITLFATEVYGIKRVIGFKYGWMGLMDEGVDDAFELTPSVVKDIQRFGGSFLGSSRGRPVHLHGEEMVDNLVRLGVNVVICLGGDGTQKGGSDLYGFCKKRGLDISVIGVPKTIDNDVSFVAKTFGFETAVDEATVALKAAQAEARSHMYGIGVVKLMGRHSGFVAAQAAVAFGGAHIVLIPENEITMDTLFQLLEERFKRKKYCVVVVAEGFGQSLLEAASTETDASGNKKLGDIGTFVKSAIEKYLKSKYEESTVKYIDPSYMIRACPATTSDSAFCMQLANNAVHEALAGATNCLIGYWNNTFTTVPIKLCVSTRKTVNLHGDLWRAVREITVSLKDKRSLRKSLVNDPIMGLAGKI